MLVLTRKFGESITIGDDIKITIIQVKGKQVRLGVEAPRHIKVHREEVAKAIEKELAFRDSTKLPKTGTED